MLADNDYLNRHNSVAKIIPSKLANKYKLLEILPPYYKYSPAPVLESSEALLYWDRPILTDRTVEHNRPDILIIEKRSRRARIVDIGVPLSHNLRKVETEKIRKYQHLAIAVKRLWKLESVTILPLIISAEGILTGKLKENITALGLFCNIICTMQKATILQTCHLVRTFLSL